jgi:hypothetical protein
MGLGLGMTDREQTEHFANELDRMIDRFRSEYQISYASVIGTLNIKAVSLTIEASEDDPE